MSVQISKQEQRWAVAVAIAVIVASCLPYLAAWLLAPADTRYTGLLINHYDGHSYYAKMQQGARGDWLFHLAFTPEPHDGAFIFTFYLALGHVATALDLPIPLIYHLARAATGLFLLFVAYRFVALFFQRIPSRRAAFLLLALSSGFGWLLAPLGATTADWWVAEGYTFLSILANPHFPLAIGLMLLLFMSVLDLKSEALRPLRAVGVAVLAATLAVVQPFAVPIVLAVLAVYLALLAFRQRRVPWHHVLFTAAIALGAAPVMIYDLYVYTANPALAWWAAQNVTPSLPPWAYLLGYGLVLLLAIVGIVVALRRCEPADLFLIAWAATVAVLLYIPFALQRRFITGFHVPLALLAAIALERVVWPRLPIRRRALATGLIVAVSALTNVFVALVPVIAVADGQPPLVIPADQVAALDWLDENTEWTDTVLAPANMAHLVPAWAGNRVVYGHPFETVDAENKLREVEDFYSVAATPTQQRALLERYGVRYVLWIEASMGTDGATALALAPVWSQGDLILCHTLTTQ